VNIALALHTAARRYCLDRYAFWCERYAEIANRAGDRESDGYHYTPEALSTFPRYNVVNAILVEIERIHPGSLGDFEETKALLICVGRIGEDDCTRKPIGRIDERAIEEERDAFCRFVSELSPSDLTAVPPLPFRRVLTADESRTLWAHLRERWQISEGCWYPLADRALADVVAFQADAFSETAPASRLQDILRTRGIESVWELREYGPEYEEDVSLFDAYYDGAEGYWSSVGLDWIVYASHESSITVGGWFLQELKVIWPSWQDHVWTGVYHDHA
jgi:hypothetical protein